MSDAPRKYVALAEQIAAWCSRMDDIAATVGSHAHHTESHVRTVRRDALVTDDDGTESIVRSRQWMAVAGFHGCRVEDEDLGVAMTKAEAMCLTMIAGSLEEHEARGEAMRAALAGATS